MNMKELTCPECQKQVFWEPESRFGYCLHCLVRFKANEDGSAAEKVMVSDLADNRRRVANAAFAAYNYRTAYTQYTKAFEYDRSHPLLFFYKGISAGYALQTYDEPILNFRKARDVLNLQKCYFPLQEMTDIFTDLFIYLTIETDDFKTLLYSLYAESLIEEDFPENKRKLLLYIFEKSNDFYELSNGGLCKEDFFQLMKIMKVTHNRLEKLDKQQKKNIIKNFFTFKKSDNPT